MPQAADSNNPHHTPQNKNARRRPERRPELILVIDPTTGQRLRADLSEAQRWIAPHGPVIGRQRLFRLPNGVWIMYRLVLQGPMFPEELGRRLTPCEALHWLEKNGYDPPAELRDLPETRLLNADVRPPTPGATTGSDDDRLNPTDALILKTVRRKALKGETIALKIDRDYDYVRKRLGRLCRIGMVRKTDNGYLTCA